MRLSDTGGGGRARRVLSVALLSWTLLTLGVARAVSGEHPHRQAPSVAEFDEAAGIVWDIIGFGPGRLCIPIAVTLESEAFFDGLERVRGPHELGSRYHKGATVVTEFPESLLVGVDVAPGMCELGEMGVGPHAPLVWDERFMRSWRFRLTWVRGPQRTPVDIISTEGWKPVRTMTGPPHWIYYFLVRSKNIAITTSLELEVLSPEGQDLARLVGGMDRAIPTFGRSDQATDMEPRPYPH